MTGGKAGMNQIAVNISGATYTQTNLGTVLMWLKCYFLALIEKTDLATISSRLYITNTQ